MNTAPDSTIAPVTDCADQLAQAQRELQSLHYAVSHDLRAPVRAIAGFSQALKEQAAHTLDASALHYLQRIEESTQLLSAMIDGLLRLSRLSQADMQPMAVDLSQLCSELVLELNQQNPQQHPLVHVATPIKAWCDPHLLRIALSELLHNAWKFTRERSDAQISIHATIEAETLTLCVRDNGIGFDMRYADRLFVPFQHLQAHTEQHGLGIGLACVQRIISRHSGKLWAEAAAQQGAAFYFTLPCTDDNTAHA
ncbi:MAG: ATP-binding protein [Steroidobacteraceae bacterium]